MIYPKELHLNGTNNANTQAPFFFLDLDLSISNGTVSSKFTTKKDDYGFYIVNFAFLDGDTIEYIIATCSI